MATKADSPMQKMRAAILLMVILDLLAATLVFVLMVTSSGFAKLHVMDEWALLCEHGVIDQDKLNACDGGRFAGKWTFADLLIDAFRPMDMLCLIACAAVAANGLILLVWSFRLRRMATQGSVVCE